MKKIVLAAMLALFLLPLSGFAYDRNKVAVLLQEQDYTALLQLAAATPEAEQDLMLLNAAGYAAYQNGLPDQAIGYYTRSLSQDSSNIQALLYLGIIAKQQERYTAALPYFSQLVRLKPSNARYCRYMAECHSGLKQADSAFAWTTQAYLIAPSEPPIANAYAEGLLDRKRYAAADSVLDRALQTAPQNYPLLSTATKSAYLQKQYPRVLSWTDTLLAARQIGYTPYFYGLMAALQLEDYKRCIDLYHILQAGGHETEQVWYYAAQAYAGLRRYDSSNRLLQQCIDKAVSDNTGAYYTLLGENMVSKDKYNMAQQYFDTAYYFSHDPLVVYRKAATYEAAEQPQKAQAAYKQFLAKPGNADTALINYARRKAVPSK